MPTLTGRITHLPPDGVDPRINLQPEKVRVETDYTEINFDGTGNEVRTITSLTTGVPFWGDAPASWDFVWFDKVRLPGICRITGNVKRRVDPKAISGKKGKKVTVLGDDAAEVSIKLLLWTQKHLSTFTQLVNALKFKLQHAKGTAGTAIGDYPVVNVFHPSLNMYRINMLHVLEYTILQPEGDDGKYSVSIKCLQASLKEPKSSDAAVVSPTASGTIVSRGPGAIPEKLNATQAPKPSAVNFSSAQNYSRNPP